MSSTETTPGDPLVGQVISGRYRIEGLIGEGGVGRVYRAIHVELRRAVALKVLSTEHEASEMLRHRFRREAEALAALSHPNIVTVTDFGVENDAPFLVMELLEGRSLAELSKEEALEPARAMLLIRQVLRALAYAHAHGIVHRDLKPQNIFVRKLGDEIDHATVLDFGLARFVGAAADGRALTRTGMVIGTPAYMAPEQASGDATSTDARTDVYAVGLLLFELLCRRRPFPFTDPGKLMRAHLLEAPPPLVSADPKLRVPPALEALVARALEKRPADRFADATEMLGALDAIDPTTVRRVGTAAPVTDDMVSAPTLAATPSARLPKAAKKPAKAPLSRAMIAVAGSFALAIVAVLGIVTVWQVMTPDDEPAPPRVEPLEPPIVEPLPPPEPDVPPARDPLADPLPAPVAGLWAQVLRGRPLLPSQVRAVRAWGRENDDDVRAYLVVGHSYTSDRALSYGFPEYQNAMERDPTVRGEPHMLPDLLEMVVSRTLSREASDAVAAWYGAEARGAVNAELAREDLRRDERERLEALRERLP